MSSNKAPEKIVRWIGEDYSHNYTDIEIRQPRTSDVIYVRQDLTLDAKLKEPQRIEIYNNNPDGGSLTTFKALTQKEAEQLRRREMFEKVALIKIVDGYGYVYHEVAQMTDWILNDADEFAKGEK